MRPKVLLFILFVVVISGSCGTTPSQDPTNIGKVVFVLFDLSDSTNQQEVRAKYKDGIKKVIDRLEGGDILVADAITENPLSQSTFPVNETFPVFVPTTDNSLLVQKQKGEHDVKLKEIREKALTNVGAILEETGRSIKQTLILDSMQLAERVFSTHQKPKKVLVIFSDMIEEGPRQNFSRQKLDDTAIDRIIDSERKDKRLPNLSDVKVYVVGASAPSNPRGNAFLSVQDFWLKYFVATKADLSKERYGSGFLSFEE